MAVLSSELDGRFIGFSAGVAEKNAVSTAVLHQPGGQSVLLGNPIEVGNVLETAELTTEAAAQGTVAMAKGVGGNACNGIEMASALVIPDPATTSPHQGEGEAVVGVHHRLWMGAGGLEPPRPVAG